MTQLNAANRFAASPSSPLSVPVRRDFLLRGDEPDTALGRLLSSGSGRGGGKGGQRRLALLLTGLWVCSRYPYETQRPASWWADMIGLADPQGATATRSAVTNLRELAERRYIDFVPGKEGYSPTVTLRTELGTGDAYVRPFQDEHRNYIRLPVTLWTDAALIGKLSGPGLAMFVIMLSYYNEKTNKGEGIWFSDRKFRERHGMAEATRLSGLNDLVNHGVLTMRQEKTDVKSSDDSGYRTTHRRFYTIDTRYHPPAKLEPPEPE